jgi:hypothetical protein
MTLFPPAREEGRALRWGALDVGLRAPKSRRRLPSRRPGKTSLLSILGTALNLLPSIATTASEWLQSTAKPDILSAHRPNRFAIVFAEVCDRLEVGRKTPDEPHQANLP